MALPVLVCQFATFSSRCREYTTHAMRSPGRSSATSYVCPIHADQLAALGWADVTTVETRPGSLLARVGPTPTLRALGYGS